MSEPSNPAPDIAEQRAFGLAAQAEQAAETQTAEPANSRPHPRKKASVMLEGNEDRELARAIVKIQRLEQTMKLRLMMAIFAISAVSVQLVVASLLFWGYLSDPTWRSETPETVVIAWLSATVVEVIGIVLVIARNLFPANETNQDRKRVRRLLDILEQPGRRRGK